MFDGRRCVHLKASIPFRMKVLILIPSQSGADSHCLIDFKNLLLSTFSVTERPKYSNQVMALTSSLSGVPIDTESSSAEMLFSVIFVATNLHVLLFWLLFTDFHFKWKTQSNKHSRPLMLLFVNNIIPVACPVMTIEKSAESSDRS